MNCEISVTLGRQSIKVFMQDGFFNPSLLTQTLHRHRLAEVHIQCRGKSVFDTDSGEVVLESGDAVAFGAGIFHKCREKSDDALHIAFQTDTSAQTEAVKKLPCGVAECFPYVIEQYTKGESSRLEAYLSLVLCEFVKCVPCFPVKISDRAFLIDEFFANNYNRDVSLTELSELLGLCEKQTERLIEKHTGKTFRKELSDRKRDAAIRLIDEGNLTLSQIAEKVGYKSYSGFWKSINGI